MRGGTWLRGISPPGDSRSRVLSQRSTNWTGPAYREAGGAIARNLAALYHYMQSRLLAANMRQEDQPLAEVEVLLTTLAEAWSDIRPEAQSEKRQAANAGGFGAFAAEQMEYAGQGWSA